MPTVEKVRGAIVTVRGIGTFDLGDRANVSAADAAYLCDERGDFERVGDGDEADTVDVPEGHCAEVKSDGEVCGRELPCRYHSED